MVACSLRRKGFRMNRSTRAISLLFQTLVFLAMVCLPAVSRAATTVATPTFSPAAGSYTGTQSVTIGDTTSGATIYYTTNGTTPTSSSTKYTAAISVSTSETIKAIAELSGDTNSAVASAAYAITVPTPTFSPAAGSYTGTQSVTISDATSGATIYYTTNGTTPTSSSTKYTAAISVSTSETIKAIAELSGDTNSAVASAAYTITVPTPTFSPAAGSYTGTQSVTISDATSGATIYYTTNGTTPTTSSTKYTGAISVTATETIAAIAVFSGDTNSAVGTAKYTITPTVATPTFSPAAGSYTGTQSMTISDTTSGATIYYTTNGTTPTSNSTKYTAAISVSTSETIEAIAELSGDTNSAVASAAYTITVPTPTFSPAAGTYSSSQSGTISDATSGATIYYTTNGTTPTTSSTKYTGAISVTATETIEAIAVFSGDTNSLVATAAYTITPTVATPTFSPAAGSYTGTQSVTISDTTSGATIYYTTNGTTPTSSSTKYTAAISVSTSETIKAIAELSGDTNSAVASAAYTITVPTPTFSPAAGSYTGTQSVTISDATSGATIYYTTNGTTPTTSSTKYTGAISVTATKTIEAIAVFSGDTNSAVGTAKYTITLPVVATPVITPGTESATTLIPVTITCPSGATCYYTYTPGTTGSTPSPTNGTQFTTSTSFTVWESCVVEAMATETGYTSSGAALATYTVNLTTPTPNFSPTAGNYPTAQIVTISDTDSYTTIYFTTNGTIPTTSSTVYTGSITVSSTETVEAIAVEGGYANSPVATATYTLPGIATSTTTLAATSGGSPVTSLSSGSMVTLTATVASGTNTITSGTVNFCDATATHCTDVHRLGTAQLNSAGTASIKFWPSVGSHSYKAIFVGTSSNLTSSSSTAQLTVTGGYPTFTSITGSSGSPGNYTLTATVTGILNNSVAPTGTVSILDTGNANAVMGTGSLSSASTALNFSIVSTPGTGINPGDIAVGDLNGDGRLDMAVPNCNDGTVTILLGNGDGTFTAASGSPISMGSSESCFVAVGDFSGNGISDLAVANEVGNTITILQGKGDGTFSASSQGPISVGKSPSFIAVGDFNDDGNLDLGVANNSDGTMTVLLGSGNGSFSVATGSPVTVGSDPTSIALGDFNGDGKLDLAVANELNNTVTILLSNGDGTFTPANGSPVTAGNYPTTIAVADFDGDGNLDLAIADDNASSVTIMMGNGDGTFKPPATINAPIVPYAVAVGDFNGDGIPDLAISSHSSFNTVATLLGKGDGTFSSYNISFLIDDASSYWVATGDFNGDGISDLAVLNQGWNINTWEADNGTITILQTSAGETATATINGIAPLGFGFHNVEASYGGDGTSAASTSTTVPLETAGIEASPVSGPVGSVFTILGSGFGSAQETSSITVGGLSAVPTAWSDTQLKAQVPNGLGIGPQSVVVTVAGQSVSGTFNVTPGITNITPSSGLPGTPVNITGTNFGSTQGSSTVTFNGTAATSIPNWGATSITAAVPPGAITGSVVVTVNSVASNAVPFTVFVPPTISSLSQTSGVVGTPVTIAGINFGASQGTSTVTFNGTAATISNWSATSIAAVVPSGATTGNVVVTVNGSASNGVPFTVLTDTLASSANPSSYGGSVTFTATFSVSGLTGAVTFMDSGTQIGAGTITGATATYTTSGLAIGTHSITASWPGNSTYPPITSSPVLQQVQNTPAVYSLSPTSGVVDTPVTIAGINFGASQGTSTVTFNGTAATISNWSATSIAAVVPSGATTGNVVVTVNGSASNGVPFTVLTETLTSSANPSSDGGSVTFNATFSVSGLTGAVTFMDSGIQIGAGTITGSTATYSTSSLAIGTHSITASWPGNSTYPPISSGPVLQKVQNTPAVYSWPWPSEITFGQTLASSQLIGGSAVVSGTFAWTSPGTIPVVGATTESVTFTPSDKTDYSSVTGSVTLTVEPIESPAPSTSVTYTYDSQGRVYQAQYSTSSGTITVTYSYDSAGNRTSVVTQ